MHTHAGIASRSLPRYDIFGDSVNVASRMKDAR
jgi:class 3 adenylate cyclase